MIIVTGAAGFLGRYVIRELAGAGETVLGLTRADVDIRLPGSLDSLPDKKIEAFVHLAAVIPAKVEDLTSDIFLETNALGTLHALEFCRRRAVPKFILATTMYEALGHRQFPITEDMGRKFAMTGDHTAYVISKIAAAQYVDHYARQYGMQGIILRLVGLLGHGRQEGAFEVFYRRAKEGKPLEIWGEHEARRDSLYVKDAALAIYLALKSQNASGLYNVSSGHGRTVEEEVEIFSRAFGSVPIVYRPEIEDKKTSYVFSFQRAAEELGWCPQFDFREIIADYDREASAAC